VHVRAVAVLEDHQGEFGHVQGVDGLRSQVRISREAHLPDAQRQERPGPAGLPGKAAAGAALIAGLLFFGKMVPLVGGVLSLVGMILLAFGVMIGLGAAWMTRMGTRPYVAPFYPAAPAAVPAAVPAAAAPAAQPPAVPPAQQ